MPDNEAAEIHATPLSVVYSALGECAVERIALGQGNERARLLGELADCTSGQSRIVACRLGLGVEFVVWALSRIGLKVRPKGSLEAFRKSVDDIGWSETGEVVTLPSFDSARYCFPFSDHGSHRFLIRQMLFPRRYSLSFPTRLLLRAYTLLLTLFPKAAFLYRDVCLRIEKR